jgi:salicylate hydroxylase
MLAERTTLSRRLRVVVVGAGVAGCILARQLSQRPELDVICLERVFSKDHETAGTALNIGPNAANALFEVDPDLAQTVTEAGLPWRDWKMSLADGRELFSVTLSDFADRDGWRIAWSELYRILRKSCDAAIRYGCSTIDIERSRLRTEALRVEWNDADGHHSLDDVDLLIAADGRFSQTRKAFGGDASPDYLGVSIFRLLVPDTSEGLIEDHHQWFNGPNRLLTFRVRPNSVYIAGTFPIDGGDSQIDEAFKEPSFLRAAYTPLNSEPSKPVKWLIEQICLHRDAIHWARMQDHPIHYAEQDLPLLYVGDAAHGMVPTLGQGATQAIEDACVASQIVFRQLDQGSANPCHWLELIERSRTERMRFVMAFSRDASDTMLPGADVVAGTLRKMEPAFQAQLRELWRNVCSPASAPIS